MKVIFSSILYLEFYIDDDSLNFSTQNKNEECKEAENSTPSKQQVSYLDYSDNYNKSQTNEDKEILNIEEEITPIKDDDEFANMKQMKIPQNPTIETKNSQEEFSPSKISPIKIASPRDEDPHMLEMFLKGHKNSTQREKQNEYGMTQILGNQIEDKSLGNSYNSLLYFKTTDEGQKKMYNSYDYYEDLIKGTKASRGSKFLPSASTIGKSFML